MSDDFQRLIDNLQLLSVEKRIGIWEIVSPSFNSGVFFDSDCPTLKRLDKRLDTLGKNIEPTLKSPMVITEHSPSSNYIPGEIAPILIVTKSSTGELVGYMPDWKRYEATQPRCTSNDYLLFNII